MIVDYDVPFYSNTPDDTHCAQATYRMIRGYFEPGTQVTWAELDEGTGKTKLFATWRATGLVWMSGLGYEVRVLDAFDYMRFSTDGLPYLYDFFGPESGAWLGIWLDLPVERERSGHLHSQKLVEQRVPTQDDIEFFLDSGFLVQLTVNLKRLNNEAGYLGHGVVVKGYDGTHFKIHDPGLPANADRIVTREAFEAAWADPNLNAKHLAAFRKA